MLTVTVLKTAAPQTVQTADGPVKIAPGESVTAEFSEAQEAAIRAATGHFTIEAEKPAPEPPKVPQTTVPAPKPHQQVRRRGRGRH